MRISTANSFDSAIGNLQRRQQDLSESQMQLTTGKRINVASDDPVAAARLWVGRRVCARHDVDVKPVAPAFDAGVVEPQLEEARHEHLDGGLGEERRFEKARRQDR